MPRNKSTIRYPRTKRFTIADCIALNDALNSQTVRTLVRGAIAAGEVTVVGKQPQAASGRGRPSFVLALA